MCHLHPTARARAGTCRGARARAEDLEAEHGDVALLRELHDDVVGIGGRLSGAQRVEESFCAEEKRDLIVGVGLDAVVCEERDCADLSARAGRLVHSGSLNIIR